jgi:hypothetical protein
MPYEQLALVSNGEEQLAAVFRLPIRSLCNNAALSSN